MMKRSNVYSEFSEKRMGKLSTVHSEFIVKQGLGGRCVW